MGVEVPRGERIADPYRWLEAIDSNSVAEWVKSQNAVTMPYLASLPGRDLLKQRITALYEVAVMRLGAAFARFTAEGTPPGPIVTPSVIGEVPLTAKIFIGS